MTLGYSSLELPAQKRDTIFCPNKQAEIFIFMTVGAHGRFQNILAEFESKGLDSGKQF